MFVEDLSPMFDVSIHAPAGGATRPPHFRTCPACVSIHAPAGGATRGVGGKGLRRLFQSTRPRGARHTGAEAATGGTLFQSTRPRGARQAATDGTLKATTFQSTRPRGARLYNCIIRHFVVLESPIREPHRMPNNILRKPDIKNYNHNNIKRI